MYVSTARFAFIKSFAAIGLAAGMSLAVAACSSGSSSSGPSASAASPSSSSSASPSAAPSAAATPTAQLTGDQLWDALLTGSFFPTGYSTPKGALQGATGGSLETASAKYDLATMTCADIGDDLGQTGFGETAMAVDTYMNSAQTQAFLEAIYQFRTAAAAQSFVSGIDSLSARCGSFTVTGGSSGSTTASLTTTPAAPVSGDKSIMWTESEGASGAASTTRTQLTLDGDVVAIAAAQANGTAPAASPSTALLSTELISDIEQA